MSQLCKWAASVVTGGLAVFALGALLFAQATAPADKLNAANHSASRLPTACTPCAPTPWWRCSNPLALYLQRSRSVRQCDPAIPESVTQTTPIVRGT